MLNQEEIKTIRETVPLLKDKGQTITQLSIKDYSNNILN